MFMRTYDAVTDDEIKDFHAFWDDYLDGNIRLYEEYYRQDEERIRRIIGMQFIFEYLAFTHELSERKIYDPLRVRDLNEWLDRLLGTKEFCDVVDASGRFYPSFKEKIDARLVALKKDAQRDAGSLGD